MRRHDARKWLHAILDLLPVILIPVFMIYSHRHNVAEDTVVTNEIPVYYESNEVNSFSDIVEGNLYHISFTVDNPNTQFFVLTFSSYYNVSGNFYREDNLGSYSNVPYLRTSTVVFTDMVLAKSHDTSFDVCDIYDTTLEFDFVYRANTSQTDLTYLVNFISKSNALIIKDYTEETITYQNDVMTSFVQTFNNTVNTYFNMGNVFGLNGVYEWFNTNIFGGNAPTIIYSVWNIALYELLMDLLMLLYALFMWFIDFCQDLIDRCFTTSKGGKH